jgi:hypothetical protein
MNEVLVCLHALVAMSVVVDRSPYTKLHAAFSWLRPPRRTFISIMPHGHQRDPPENLSQTMFTMPGYVPRISYSPIGASCTWPLQQNKQNGMYSRLPRARQSLVDPIGPLKELLLLVLNHLEKRY